MNTECGTLLRTAALALGMWFAAIIVISYAVEPSEQVIAWIPREQLAATLAALPISVLSSRPGGFIVLRSTSPGLVRTLYASGAWLVLPVRKGGCLSA